LVFANLSISLSGADINYLAAFPELNCPRPLWDLLAVQKFPALRLRHFEPVAEKERAFPFPGRPDLELKPATRDSGGAGR